MAEEKELLLWGATSPGEILEEKLQEMNVDVNDFAARIGYTPKTVNELLKAKCRVTAEMAYSLEFGTGIPQYCWLEAQKLYERDLWREKIKKSLKKSVVWRKFFPIGELNPRTWIKDFNNKEDGVSPILKFFGVASPKAWENYYYKNRLKVAFRISLAETEDPYAASVWMRRGEILADEIKMEKQNDKKVRSAIKKAMPQFVELAKNDVAAWEDLRRKKALPKPKVGEDFIDDGMHKLQELGAKFGIKVLYAQNFKSAPIHGMARWYKDIPVIQLHDRFKDRNAFWFTFFHELGHIVLHGKKDIFIKNVYYGNKNQQKDDEANTFAQKYMVQAGLEV